MGMVGSCHRGDSAKTTRKSSEEVEFRQKAHDLAEKASEHQNDAIQFHLTVSVSNESISPLH